MPDQIGRRNAARLRLSAEARLITRDGTYPVEISDISETGAHLAHNGIEPFTWCVLRWLGNEFDGEMVWANAKAIGVQFTRPLPPEALLAIKENFPDIDESRRLPVPDRRRRV